jgi:OmcA/MtrC family decaheme c-type cytochrome
VAIASDTHATVNFKLSNELGLPLRALPAANIRFTIAQLRPGVAGAGSTWHAYVTKKDAAELQATTETATTSGAVFTDNGDGTYSYTFAKPLNGYAPDGATYDGSLTHRVGLELRSNDALALAAANNAPFDFVPATGSTTDFPLRRDIVDNDTCFACHDRLEFHGGPRTDVKYCVTCHNPGTTDGQAPNNTLDMVVMIHKIHMGENLANGYVITGFGGPVDFGEVVFPQDQRNCQTCHQESDADTPQASNWRTTPYARACGACHDTVNFQTGENHASDGPGGIAATDDQCVTCHGPTSTIDNGNLRVDVVHQIPEKLAAEKFKFNLLGVTNTAPGQMPIVKFSVTDPTNNNAPYNILTDTAFTSGGASTLSLDIAWTTADYTNRGSGSASGSTGTPAQPIKINPLVGGTPATGPDAEGAFTSTSPIALPADLVGSIGVAMEGHPGVDVNSDGSAERIAVPNVVNFFASTGSVVPRRDSINVKKCDDCHNVLSAHGSNRSDNIQVCAECHNPNATDIGKRGVPLTDCDNELGPDDVPIDLKYMIHAIHSGPIASYKVCGFGNSANDFSDLRYPGKLNNCEGCHYTPDANDTASYYPVDPTLVLATTVDAGANRASPTDDVAWSPNTAVCSACHTSAVAEQHMLQNGGSKTLSKNADGTTAGGPLETCQLCHGPGRTADVKVLHGVDNFEFQAPAAEP